jgi:hypothetical protein
MQKKKLSSPGNKNKVMQHTYELLKATWQQLQLTHHIEERDIINTAVHPCTLVIQNGIFLTVWSVTFNHSFDQETPSWGGGILESNTEAYSEDKHEEAMEDKSELQLSPAKQQWGSNEEELQQQQSQSSVCHLGLGRLVLSKNL